MMEHVIGIILLLHLLQELVVRPAVKLRPVRMFEHIRVRIVDIAPLIIIAREGVPWWDSRQPGAPPHAVLSQSIDALRGKTLTI